MSVRAKFSQTTAFRYGTADQLTRITYRYDPQGRRSSKTVNAVTTGYRYDDANVLPELTVSNGTVTASSPVKAQLFTGLGMDELISRSVLPVASATQAMLSHFLVDGNNTLGLLDATSHAGDPL